MVTEGHIKSLDYGSHVLIPASTTLNPKPFEFLWLFGSWVQGLGLRISEFPKNEGSCCLIPSTLKKV